jgi:EmrB/QacA subfamily drug resistance transporter
MSFSFPQPNVWSKSVPCGFVKRPSGAQLSVQAQSASSPGTGETSGGPGLGKSKGLYRGLLPMMVVLSLGAVMTIFDATIVNVSLDTLGRDLHLSLTDAQWVSTSYLLTLAFAVPLTGWATERVGTKRLWMGALAAFIGGSILCGLSWSPASLIAFRVLQGAGGGMVMPVGQSIIVRSVPRGQLGRVMGVLTMPLLLGPVLGPVIGGLIVTHLSWRWIFFVNVPLGIPTLLFAARLLRNEYPAERHPLDVRGLLLLPPGLVFFVYGLSRLSNGGGEAAQAVTAGCLLIGVLLIALFALHARGLGRRALLDVDLFKRVTFRASSVIAFCFGLLMFGGFFLLPLYYQLVRGQSALHAGLLMAPQGLGSVMILPIAGRLSDRFGAGRVVPVGLVLAMAATAVFARAGTSTSYAVLAVAQFFRGVGMSSVMTPAYAAAYGSLERDAVPRATSAVNVINRVGGSTGAALLAVVLTAGFAGLVPGTSGNGALDALGAIDPARHPALDAQVATVFAHAYWVLFAITALALIPAAFLPRGRRRPAEPAAEPPPSPPAASTPGDESTLSDAPPRVPAIAAAQRRTPP